MSYQIVRIAGVFCLCCATLASADSESTGPNWLDRFSQTWQEADWQQKGRFHPTGYMRPQEDAGWPTRMNAFQGLVRRGDESIPLLLETLRAGDTPQRILAAQTLGYLGPNVPADPLVSVLQSEADPTVRLYLVDTLGMLGKGNAVDWHEYLESESNRDVKRHVRYVQERAGEPLDVQVVQTLKQWDSADMNTATMGQPAPDFALLSAQGEYVRLSDFRSKKAVVLVFIYGDT